MNAEETWLSVRVSRCWFKYMLVRNEKELRVRRKDPWSLWVRVLWTGRSIDSARRLAQWLSYKDHKCHHTCGPLWQLTFIHPTFHLDFILFQNAFVRGYPVSIVRGFCRCNKLGGNIDQSFSSGPLFHKRLFLNWSFNRWYTSDVTHILCNQVLALKRHLLCLYPCPNITSNYVRFKVDICDRYLKFKGQFHRMQPLFDFQLFPFGYVKNTIL